MPPRRRHSDDSTAASWSDVAMEVGEDIFDYYVGDIQIIYGYSPTVGDVKNAIK